ncbi:MAG TPA: hypothetical protein VD995_20505 [Azospirillum sp.]|nr:hypothetical protein [Azospirillum sp.]
MMPVLAVRRFAAVLALGLAACGTPEVLERPVAGPTMPPPKGEAMPLPRYAERIGEETVTRTLDAIDAPGPGIAALPSAGAAPALPGKSAPGTPAPGDDEWSDLLAVPGLPAPGTYRRSGDQIVGPQGPLVRQADGLYRRADGTWSRRSGDTWMHSDGTSTQRNGDTYFHSDGGWTRRSGNTIVDSKGGSCTLAAGTAVCAGR